MSFQADIHQTSPELDTKYNYRKSKLVYFFSNSSESKQESSHLAESADVCLALWSLCGHAPLWTPAPRAPGPGLSILWADSRDVRVYHPL